MSTVRGSGNTGRWLQISWSCSRSTPPPGRAVTTPRAGWGTQGGGGGLVRVQISGVWTELSFEDWEARVRAGRIPANALVIFEPVTGSEAVAAGELEMYRSLRSAEVMAYQDRFRLGPAPIITALLVGVQIRLWWLARLPGVRHELERLLMVSEPHILEDAEVWRLLTAGVLQTSFAHLLGNMTFLAYTGWNLERGLGRSNLVLLFTASVFGGSLLSMMLRPETSSLGSSGGVFGLVAASVVFGFTRPELLPRRGRQLFGLALLPYLVLMFLNGLTNPRVDNWSHFGGMVTGGALAFLLDPETLQRRPGRNRRIAAVVASVAAGIALAFAILGPRFEWLRDADVARRRYAELRSGRTLQDDGVAVYRPLTWGVPAGWTPGTSAIGGTAFVSPAGNRELRAWSLRSDEHDELVDVQDLATAWGISVQERSPGAILRGPSAMDVHGRDGLHLVATIPGDVPRTLEWRGSARGVWSLEELWQVDVARAERLQPLRDRLRDSVVWREPQELRDARRELARLPDSPRRKGDLAVALGRAGELDEALALHDEILAARPDDPDAWLDALETVQTAGPRIEDPAAWWDRALRGDPPPSLVDQVARGLLAADRSMEAEGLLDLAWRRRPGDRTLRRARRKLELPVVLDPQTGLPWEVVYDAITGERRKELPAEPPELSIGAARSAGEAAREARDQLAAAAAAEVRAESARAVGHLLVLRMGHRPAIDAELRAALVADLERVVTGTAPRWMPDTVADAVRGHPGFVDVVRAVPLAP